MRTVEAPNHAFIKSNEVSVFLAGGISDCFDWQSEIIKQFNKICKARYESVVLLNPRRENFDTADESATTIQIHWEFDYLNRADIILFWFPKETLCPITLYELGYQLGKLKDQAHRKIVVGADPKYKRLQDIKTQTDLVDLKMVIHNSLEDVVKHTYIHIKHALDS